MRLEAYGTSIVVALAAASDPAQPMAPELETSRFRLVHERGRFALEDRSSGAPTRLAIPKPWLVAASHDEPGYVSPFKYSALVTAFPVGDGRVGLHLSSYDVNDRGSAAAAAGTDVFLVYDPNRSSARPGLIRLGVTKQRVKAMGCLRAEASHFLLADVDGDGLVDVGRIREEIRCAVDEEGRRVVPQQYVQDPARWHRMVGGGWVEDRSYEGRIPEKHTELPLIGVAFTPVDFFAKQIWKTADPARWRSGPAEAPAFVPAFRRKLIEQEREARGR